MNPYRKTRSTDDAIPEEQIDYSQIYKRQEAKQLNKRLKTTRIILLISATVTLLGGLVFWFMTEKSFSSKNLMFYTGLAFLFFLFSLLSKHKPYLSLITSLGLCISFWILEVVMGKSDELLIELSIQKLFIISIIVLGIPSSREAELIRKELNFS